MKDTEKDKDLLIAEIRGLRRRVDDLERSQSVPGRTTEGGELYKAVSQAVDVLVVYDESLRYTFINERGASFLGLDSVQVIGKTNREIMGPRADAVESHVRRAFENRERVFVLHEIPLQDGVRLFDTVYSPVLDESGRVTRVTGMCRDVTEDRRRVEKLEETVKLRTEELRRSEKKYRALVDNAGQGILIAQEGTIKFVNPKCLEFTGYTEEQLLEKAFIELVHPEDRNFVTETHLQRMHGDTLPYRNEFRLIIKSGETKWMEINSTLVIWDGAQAALCFLTDVTDRRLAEESQDKEKTKFQTLAENAPLGLIMISKEGDFTYVNKKFIEMVGYDLNDIPNGREWFHKAYADTVYRHGVVSAWKNDLEEFGPGEQRPRVFTVKCKDGTDKIIHFRPVQLITGEHLMTCEDITQRERVENSLREHVSMLESILNRAADGICACHIVVEPPYVRFTHWNPRMVEITGYTMDEMNRLGWYQTMYPNPEMRQRAIERMSRMREGHDIAAEEWLITSKEGKEVPLSISTSVLKEEAGRVHILALMQDISRQRESRERLRESEEKSRALSEATFEAIFLSDKGICIGQNLSAEKMFGYTAEEALGRGGIEWIAPEYRQAVINNMLSGYEEPYEAVALRRDGSTFPCEIQGKMLTYQGSLCRVTALRDITERKEAENRLRSSEERFRLLIDTMNQGFGIQDQNGVVTYVNNSQCEMLGYSREEIVGRRFADFFEEESEKTLLNQFDKRRDGKPGLYEITFVRKDGERVDAIMSGTPVFDQAGVFKGSFGVATDITERRRMEKALRESRARLLLALEGANLGLWDWDLTTGKAVWTERTQTMLGYGPGDVEPNLKTWKRLVHPDDWSEIAERLNDLSAAFGRNQTVGDVPQIDVCLMFAKTSCIKRGTSWRDSYTKLPHMSPE